MGTVFWKKHTLIGDSKNDTLMGTVFCKTIPLLGTVFLLNTFWWATVPCTITNLQGIRPQQIDLMYMSKFTIEKKKCVPSLNKIIITYNAPNPQRCSRAHKLCKKEIKLIVYLKLRIQYMTSNTYKTKTAFRKRLCCKSLLISFLMTFLAILRIFES